MLATDKRYQIFKYSPQDAKIYSDLGISRTTYEIGYNYIQSIIGDLEGKQYLDFGCGAGRSTKFLKKCGADRVIGVDHDKEMINLARQEQIPGTKYVIVSNTLPFKDNYFDGIVCVSVFMEIRKIEVLRDICKELFRVSRKGARFILSTASKQAYDAEYYSYVRHSQGELHSGSLVPCEVTINNNKVQIIDTYWSEQDYISALKEAGWMVDKWFYPTPEVRQEWHKEELEKPPYLIIQSTK